MTNLKHLFISGLFIVAFYACQNQKNGGIAMPLDEVASVVNSIENNLDYGGYGKLESDDGRLTIYTSVDSLSDYPSQCVVLYHDGEQTVAVSEAKWRKKHGIKDDEPCALFDWGQSKLFTVENRLDKEHPIYIVVTVELNEREGGYPDETRTSAQAYTIKEGELQPVKAFCENGEFLYEAKNYIGYVHDWTYELPSIWPAVYDAQSRTLRLAGVDDMGRGHLLYYSEWKYDDKMGFQKKDDVYMLDEDYMVDASIWSMTERLPRHKVLLAYCWSANEDFLYASWPASAKWTDKPSVIVKNGTEDAENACYHFPSKDGYEYVVFVDPHPEGSSPSIEAVEVRKNGKTISREEIEYD